MSGKSMNYEALVSVIGQTHLHFQQQAAKAVNVSLTIRNWLIGFYIVEFEQKGEDRAKYGAGLLNKLAIQLSIKGLVSAELSRCRQFYHCYPQILGALTQEFKHLIPSPILGALTQELKEQNDVVLIRGALSSDSENKYQLNGSVIKNNALVEFATANMDNHLFVSKYLLELPKKEQLEAFILKEMEAWK